MNSLNLKKFHNPELIQKIVKNIDSVPIDQVNIMEVCGTHTMAIARFGIKTLLPSSVKLLSGPGCPVCVTPIETIDALIELAMRPDVILASFGDMIRVPGSKSSLEKAKSEGADIRIIYSPLELLTLSEKYPDKNIVFAGVGFETTSPSIAAVIIRAKEKNIKNLFVFSAFKTIPEAMRMIVSQKKVNIDGFLLPGHVSAIIGSYPYQFLASEFGLTGTISGFEPVDILLSIYLILKRIHDRRPGIDIQYRRTIKPEGNVQAKNILDKIFEKTTSSWRAIGNIPDSGLKLNKNYKIFSAEEKFKIKSKKVKGPKNCICGKILLGLALPTDCSLFDKACTPQRAIGPCMVSSEGTCAAYYKYQSPPR